MKRLITFHSAVEIIKREISLQEQTILVPTVDSLGFCLAEDIISEEYHPAARTSSVDGFAVRLADKKFFSKGLKVQGTIAAGQALSDNLRRIKPGHTIHIMTGAIVPNNCDAVLKIEETTPDNWTNPTSVAINKAVKRGLNIRDKGEDVKPGDLLLKKRCIIDFGALSVLLLMGKEKVYVYKPPRVGVVSTGDELVHFSERVQFHQKREVNSWVVSKILHTAGAETKRYPVIQDDYDKTVEALRAIVHSNDILVVSGGMSMGKFDYVREAVKQLGFRILFHGVNQKPGKPLAFGVLDNGQERKYFFGLPGNPVASITNALLIIKPIIRYMLTGSYEKPPTFTATVAQDFVKDDLRLEFARAVYYPKSGKVRILKNQSSGVISSFTRGNCYAVLPSNRRLIKKGSYVQVIPFNFL